MIIEIKSFRILNSIELFFKSKSKNFNIVLMFYID